MKIDIISSCNPITQHYSATEMMLLHQISRWPKAEVSDYKLMISRMTRMNMIRNYVLPHDAKCRILVRKQNLVTVSKLFGVVYQTRNAVFNHISKQ